MKNPWMSAWLSAANKAAGPMRGMWAAQAKRQQAALTRETLKAVGLGGAAKKRAGGKGGSKG